MGIKFATLSLFGLMLLDAAVTFFAIGSGGKALFFINMLLILAALVMMIFAMIRQRNSDLPTGVRRVTGGVLAYWLTGFAIGTVYAMVYAFRHPGMQPPQDFMEYRNEPFSTKS